MDWLVAKLYRWEGEVGDRSLRMVDIGWVDRDRKQKWETRVGEASVMRRRT